jgi:hypothetical protein
MSADRDSQVQHGAEERPAGHPPKVEPLLLGIDAAVWAVEGLDAEFRWEVFLHELVAGIIAQ